MSRHIVRLIPQQPDFVPEPACQEAARSLIAEAIPDAEGITTQVTEHTEFIDQGENFEDVFCPFCGAVLSDGDEPWESWWHTEMDRTYEKRFTDLRVVTPCCQKGTTLNDLRYELPAGFARFVLEIEDLPRPLGDELLASLAQTLGCPLRIVWVWY